MWGGGAGVQLCPHRLVPLGLQSAVFECLICMFLLLVSQTGMGCVWVWGSKWVCRGVGLGDEDACTEGVVQAGGCCGLRDRLCIEYPLQDHSERRAIGAAAGRAPDGL